MIRATFDAPSVTAGDGPAGSRTITGVAVPYGVPGRVSDGSVVVFEPGSLDANERPVALRDHDRTRPIGRVAAAADRGDHLEATVKVSRFGDGDEALILAADGVLGAFSVGVEPTDWYHDDDDAMHVTAGDWRELSLLTIGAYDRARVATVTATQPDEGSTMTITDPALELTPEDPDEPDEPIVPEDPEAPDEPAIEATAPLPVPIAAGAGPRRVAASPYAHVGLRQLAGLIMAARGGDRQARRMVHAVVEQNGTIEAQLANVTLVGTDNVGLGYRPAYQAELVEIVSQGSPLVDVLRQGDLERGDYPNKTFNQWTKRPQVALQANEKDPINSTPVSIGAVSVPVKSWATGNDLSRQLLDFGSPSFVEDYIRAAGVDYAETIETYVATILLGAATPITTAADDTFITVVQKLMGAMDPTKVPAGALFLAVSYDVGVGMIGVQQNDGPAFWDGSISFGSAPVNWTVGGLNVVVSTNLPAKTYLLGSRNSATWYDLPGTPFNLQAVNVGHLGLDIGVFGYGACGVQYPGSLVKTTQPAT